MSSVCNCSRLEVLEAGSFSGPTCHIDCYFHQCQKFQALIECRYAPLCLQRRRFPELSQIFMTKHTAISGADTGRLDKENQAEPLPQRSSAAATAPPIPRNWAKKDNLQPSKLGNAPSNRETQLPQRKPPNSSASEHMHQSSALQSNAEIDVGSPARMRLPVSNLDGRSLRPGDFEPAHGNGTMLRTAEEGFQAQRAQMAPLPGQGGSTSERRDKAASAQQASMHMSKTGDRKGNSHPDSFNAGGPVAWEDRLASGSAAEPSGRQQEFLQSTSDAGIQRRITSQQGADQHATARAAEDTCSEWLHEDALDDWPEDSLMMGPEPKRMKTAPQHSLQRHAAVDVGGARHAAGPSSNSHAQQRSSGPNSFSFRPTAGCQQYPDCNEASRSVHSNLKEPFEGTSLSRQTASRDTNHTASAAPKQVLGSCHTAPLTTL